MSCRKFQVLNFMLLKKKHITTENTHTHKNQILNYVSENKNFITFRCCTRACVSKGLIKFKLYNKKNVFKHIVLKSTRE